MRHYIIVKYKDSVDERRKAGLIPEIQALFDRTTEIPGIHGVKLYPNCVSRANRYDLMIEISMEREALDLYDECEAHKIWKRDYGELIDKKAIFDCM